MPDRRPELTYREEMTVIHRIVRREFRILPPVVRAVPDGDRARAAEVGAWVWEVLDFLHHHHVGEDTHVWPVLRQRVAGDPGVVALVDRMEAQHEGLADALATATSTALRWRDGAAASDRDALAAELEAMRGPTLEHLDQEEAELCPLAERHLTRAEWFELSRHGQRSTPRRQGAFVLGAILEEASPVERAVFVGHLPVPIRWVAAPMFEGPYRRRMARVRGAATA